MRNLVEASRPRRPLFVVTVDTEADDAWRHPDRIGLANLQQVPRFQELCESYGVVPTYLVTYECAVGDEAHRVLRPIVARRGCEIGHHLHCWSTPPFQREGPTGIDAAWLQAYQYELPQTLFREKADALHEAIERAYGVRPTAHRAGRWGIDRRTLDWLQERHYLVDTSLLPLCNLHACRGRTAPGPDFRAAPQRVHGAGEGNSRLLEVPATVDVPDSLSSRACARFIAGGWPGRGVVDRLFRSRYIGGGRRLCPDPRYPVGFLTAAVQRAAAAPGAVVNLSLHSSELMLGGSPFSRTPEQAARVWERLQEVFAAVTALNLAPAKLSQVASEWPLGAPETSGDGGWPDAREA